MKKIAIIGSVGVPACYGGFETLVENIVMKLSKRYDITVYCSYKAYKDHPTEWNGAHLKYINLDANGVSCLPYDTLSAMDAVKYADVLLLLGSNAIFILLLYRLFGCRKRIITNIDGLESSREKFNPLFKFYCSFGERFGVSFSDVVISDNKAIMNRLLEQYPKMHRCELIEYGADQCEPVSITHEDIVEYPFLKKQYAFSVCRIEKENNVHLTLEAFSMLPDKKLVIVGNWNKSDFSKKLRIDYSGYENIVLLDPVFDKRKINLLRSNCFLYIHGHHCGGTNPSLVEAMYLGCAILAYDVSYNRETTENKAVYYKTADDIRSLVSSISSEQLSTIKESMKEIASRRYTWDRITSLYSTLFE